MMRLAGNWPPNLSQTPGSASVSDPVWGHGQYGAGGGMGPFANGFNSLKNFAGKAFTDPTARYTEFQTDQLQNPILGQIIQYILIFMGFVGLILVCLIIYGGFVYMTSQGNEEKTGKARQYITNGVIGLIILILTYAATVFVFTQLATSTGAVI